MNFLIALVRIFLSTAKMTCADCCMFLFALIFPPLGVFCARGCGVDLLINIGLTCLGFIPGVLHACYVIVKRDELAMRGQPVTVIVQNP